MNTKVRLNLVIDVPAPCLRWRQGAGIRVSSKKVSMGVAIEVYGSPKLEDHPHRGVLRRIRVSKHQVNRHPDFIISRRKHQH